MVYEVVVGNVQDQLNGLCSGVRPVQDDWSLLSAEWPFERLLDWTACVVELNQTPQESRGHEYTHNISRHILLTTATQN